MLKNIFGRIWALWGLVSFLVTFIIIFLPSMGAYLFKNKVKGQTYFIDVARVWMRFWLTIIGCPLKVYGKENFAPGENYVITYNHNALLDVPISAPFIPGPNKTIAKSSFAKIPIFNFYYKRGSVLVDRKSERSRTKSFDDMRKVLRMGIHMCVYPEGTRNRTKEPLKKFYDGAFKLAIAANKKVLPAVINGTEISMPIHKSFFLWPTPLKLHFLPAVSTDNKTSEVLKNEVFSTMWNKFVEVKENNYSK